VRSFYDPVNYNWTKVQPNFSPNFLGPNFLQPFSECLQTVPNFTIGGDGTTRSPLTSIPLPDLSFYVPDSSPTSVREIGNPKNLGVGIWPTGDLANIASNRSFMEYVSRWFGRQGVRAAIAWADAIRSSTTIKGVVVAIGIGATPVTGRCQGAFCDNPEVADVLGSPHQSTTDNRQNLTWLRWDAFFRALTRDMPDSSTEITMGHLPDQFSGNGLRTEDEAKAAGFREGRYIPIRTSDQFDDAFNLVRTFLASMALATE
jgi:hypothetical protein